MKRLIIPMLAAMFLMTACVTGGPGGGEVENYVEVGDNLPAFTVSGPDGTFTSPFDFEGKLSVLILFNTTCPDCAREMPKVHALWEKIRGEGSRQVVAIARSQTAEEVAADWQYGEMAYYTDPDRAVFDKFANSTIPRIYIVGPNGKVLWMAVEYLLNADGSEMTAAEFEAKFESYDIN